MKEALYYEQLPNNQVKCFLCPHTCIIKPGKKGKCRVRTNHEGRLYSDIYQKISGIHTDPIEKKPLYHYYPGSNILSIGSVGCNMRCRFCQNCEISQTGVAGFPYLKEMNADEIIKKALDQTGNIGIAYTYNEPGIWAEFVLETAEKARATNLKNVMVTNGYIEEKPLTDLLLFIDAFNVDLKAFNDHFYRKIAGAALHPVLNSMKMIRDHHKHLEITFLVIPGHNDDPAEFEKMLQWISTNLGKETILHLSRYFPRYKMTDQSPPLEMLVQLKILAEKYLENVYLGNV